MGSGTSLILLAEFLDEPGRPLPESPGKSQKELEGMALPAKQAMDKRESSWNT